MVFVARRWKKRLLVYCLGLLTFMTMWTFLTLLILAAQDQMFANPTKDGQSQIYNSADDTYMGRGIQVVVGHFNGKFPEKDKINFTKEELNENHFSPEPGVGDKGRGAQLTPEEEERGETLFRINQFNLVSSDKIALNRSLPDVRKKSCKAKHYASELPDTSVIVVYHNEAFSTLLRTVTSVINRSPPELLKEVILVDDASEREFLHGELDEYVRGLSAPVKVVRARTRVGLIRARLMGAAEARGRVLTFLDSHCECTDGWIEPLLAQIASNRKAVVCPVIDVINDKTFAYQRGIELFRGGFNWNLQFRWYGVPPALLKDRAKDSTLPIKSPTMAGGLFSIDRNYFYEIGSYDPQMDIWGGENLEMSFRIWMCGGSIEIMPCSHVGHVFRRASPHDFPDNGSSRILNSNLVRVAEVWMDDWKHVFYKTAAHALTLSKDIDVSDRLELRKQLGCKDFRWYLDNVWPEHFLPKDDLFFGRVKNIGDDQCLQLTYVLSASAGGREKRITTEPCADNFTRLQVFAGDPATTGRFCLVSTPGEPGKRRHTLGMKRCTLGFDMWQLWIFDDGSIRGDENQCLGATQLANQWLVQLKECGQYDREKWDHIPYKQNLMHRVSGLCLDLAANVNGNQDEVKAPTLKKCNRYSSKQQWTFVPVDWKPTKADSFEE